MTIKFYNQFQEKAEFLATHQLPAPEFPKLLAAAFGTSGALRPEDVVKLDEIGSTKKVNEMEKVQRLFEGEGKGLDDPAIRGTKWAAYNSVVEYIDYAKQFRGEVPEDNRLEYIWMKGGQQTKVRAWNYLFKD